jgi:ABC-type polysaccharide/polyol phosphate export permease
MFEEISANAILVWFVWGFFMALGWTLGSYAMDRLLGYLPWQSRRNIR